MTIKEFYQTLGVNYDELIKRLPESILEKILLMFLNDTSMNDLNKAIENKDGEAAFRASHTLKGVCLNLDLKGLAETSVKLCEKLRNLKLENYEEEYRNLQVEYARIVELIKGIKND